MKIVFPSTVFASLFAIASSSTTTGTTTKVTPNRPSLRGRVRGSHVANTESETGDSVNRQLLLLQKDEGSIQADLKATTSIVLQGRKLEEDDFDWSGAANTVVSYLVGEIPVVGSILSLVVDTFWPDEETDIWTEILPNVQDLVDAALLDLEISSFATRLDALTRLITSYNNAAVDNKKDYMIDALTYANGLKYDYRLDKKYLDPSNVAYDPDTSMFLMDYALVFIPLHLAMLEEQYLSGPKYVDATNMDDLVRSYYKELESYAVEYQDFIISMKNLFSAWRGDHFTIEHGCNEVNYFSSGKIFPQLIITDELNEISQYTTIAGTSDSSPIDSCNIACWIWETDLSTTDANCVESIGQGMIDSQFVPDLYNTFYDKISSYADIGRATMENVPLPIDHPVFSGQN